jgi:hypothetical protein
VIALGSDPQNWFDVQISAEKSRAAVVTSSAGLRRRLNLESVESGTSWACIVSGMSTASLAVLLILHDGGLHARCGFT